MIGKEGFLIYTGLYASIRDFLTQEQKGDFLDAIHDFQETGIEPPKTSPIAMAFSIYKNQFRLDNAKHEKRAEKARQNGAKGGRPPKTEQNPENPVGYLGFGINPQKPSESYKEKEKGKEKEKDKVKDKEKELSNESIGACGLFHEKIIAFIEAYGSAGNRHDTERKYIEAITTLKGDGWPENNAHKMLIEKAAQYRVFRIQTQRKPKDPANWLKDRTWTTDYVQELENFKIENLTKEKNGNTNGNPPKTAARAYTDAARNHVEWIESQIED